MAGPSNLLLSETLLKGRDPKKMAVVLLRWVLIICCSALILFSHDRGKNQLLAHLLILFLLFSNVVVACLPVRIFSTRYFDPFIVSFDIVCVTTCLWVAGRADNELFLFYFFIVMVAAVGESIRSILCNTVLVSVVYLGVMGKLGGIENGLGADTLIRIPFFFVVALFYGYFAQLVRSERLAKVEIEEELGLSRRLRDISSRLTASLDRSSILTTLVDALRELTGIQYAAVVSKGGKALLSESGSIEISTGEKRAEMLLNSICASSADVRARANEADIVLEENRSLSSDALCFSSSLLKCLPISGSSNSDLYVCLYGTLAGKIGDFANLVILNASLALANAAQYQALLHEVEKRREVIEQLGRALKFKSDFAANVTHEVRTPIYSFIGFAELLVNGGYGALTAEQGQVVQRMLGNAQSLLELVNNILENAKLDAGQYKLRETAGSIAEFIDEVSATCEPLLGDKPLSLHSRAIDAATVVTDWSILRQIALNLVTNAIKFTPRGRVDVTAMLDKGSVLRLTVKDTGIGIAEGEMKQIFEPYRQLETSYTKKHAGTGLGLSITKKQVELLRGEIHVNSKEYQGSTFTVVVPVTVASGQQFGAAEERGGRGSKSDVVM